MFELIDGPPLLPGEQQPSTLPDEFDRVRLRLAIDSVAKQLRAYLSPELRAVYIRHLTRLAEDTGDDSVRCWLRPLLRDDASNGPVV